MHLSVLVLYISNNIVDLILPHVYINAINIDIDFSSALFQLLDCVIAYKF